MPNHVSKIVVGTIIKAEKVREADLRIHVISPDGKFVFSAKGALRPAAKLRAALQIFNLVELVVVGQNVTGATVLVGNLSVTRDIHRYDLACSVAGTCAQIANPDAAVFALLVGALDLLANTDSSCFRIFIWFYARLICVLGFDIEEFSHTQTIESFKAVTEADLENIPLNLSTAQLCVAKIVESFATTLDIEVLPPKFHSNKF